MAAQNSIIDKHSEIMFDEGNSRPFLRVYKMTSNGNSNGFSDFDLDGSSYSPAGNVASIAEKSKAVLENIQGLANASNDKLGAALPNALIGTASGFSVTTNGQAASPIIDLTSAASRFKTLSVTIIGVPSFSGTINLQMRLITSAAWTTVNNGIFNTQTGVRVSSGFTAAGTYTINLPVAAEVRLASTTWTSGQANVTIIGSYNFFTNEISNINTQNIAGSVSLSGTPNVNISQLNASSTATGSTTYRAIFASGAAVQALIKNSRANLYGLQIFNGSANAAYIRLYNSSAIVATGGTTTPIKTLCLTPSANTIIPFADFGSLFPTGLAFNISNGFADTDATPTTGAIIVNADYA